MMKIGDWCEDNHSPEGGAKSRYLVFRAMDSKVWVVGEQGQAKIGMANHFTPLPQCTGWHWKPIQAGEGYRLIDIATEKPQLGDEYFDSSHSARGGWIKKSPYSGAEFNQLFTYRRMVEPTYRPFASAKEFNPHRYRWMVGDGTTQRAFSYGDSGVNGHNFESLFCRFKFLNEDGTTEPCGVMA